jgi:uncharacterized protein YbjT (DUF2867 family)
MTTGMKVLVLGGCGYVGRRLCEALANSGWAKPVSASRRCGPGAGNLRLDATDTVSLVRALHGIDAVVNCVAGDRRSIANGAMALAHACAAVGCPRIVHVSSMAVYGRQEGTLQEQAARW